MHLLLSGLLAVAAAAAPPAHITPQMDAAIIAGVDDIYRMRFDRAEQDARAAIALNAEHPYPYMLLAGIAWTRYVYETDQGDERLIDEFDRRTKTAIAVGQRWLKAHPEDAPGLMTVGAAYGLSSRLALIRHRWLSGYWQGRTALALTKKAARIDPQLWDAYLGLGMYDYYSDLYPHFIGVLAKVVLRGNRQRGIQQLRLVAQKGHYARSNAKILLVEIYTEDPFGAKDPKKAVQLMDDLRAKYPDSATMHSAQLVAQFCDGRYKEVVKSAREYVALAQQGKYNDIERGKGLVILGTGLWALQSYAEAEAAYRQAEALMQDGRTSRWAVWAHIKHGQMDDALGRRQQAVEQYRLAAAEPDRWGFRAIAKRYLSQPYASRQPDSIPPP